MAFSKNQIATYKAMIASDDLDKLIAALLKETADETDIFNDVVMISNRFQEHEYQRIHQLADLRHIDTSRAQIVQMLLYVLDKQ